MRNMKDSGIEWIGEIPEEWEIIKMKRLGSCRNGLTYSPDNLVNENEGVLVLRSSNIKDGKLAFDDNVYVNCSIRSELFVKEGDILICSRNGSRKLIGKNAIIPRNLIASFGAFMMIFRCKTPKYIKYILDSDVFSYYLGSFLTSTINQLTADNINNMEVVYCSNIMEQQAIAAHLDRVCAEIDSVTAKTKATIEEYKKLKQAIITQAVTKGIRKGRKMKDSGVEWIGEIPEEWEIRKLFRAIDMISDIDHYMPESIDSGVPYLMTGDLLEKLSDIELCSCKQVSEDDYEQLSAKIKANKGDVIFARYATIGTVCYVDVDTPFLVSYSCLTIKPTKALLNGKFLFYYLKSETFFEDIKQYIKSNTQSNVGLDSMSKAKIILPTITEQQIIAAYLDEKCAAIDTLIAQKEQLLTELESYKKSVIYEYVTGKKEIL